MTPKTKQQPKKPVKESTTLTTTHQPTPNQKKKPNHIMWNLKQQNKTKLCTTQQNMTRTTERKSGNTLAEQMP